MRIIGGTRRGLALAEVGAGDPAAQLRPTGDRVREAIFNLLLGGRHGDPVTGAEVLDLFAGTGALGLEALSRGAAGVTLVEDGRVAQGLIRENIRRMKAEDARLLPVSALALPPCPGPAAGLILIDPPWGRGLTAPALAQARAAGWIAPQAIIVSEEGSALPPPPGLTVLDRRRYGETHVMLLQAP